MLIFMGLAKLIIIGPVGAMKVCTNFHDNLSNSCGYIVYKNSSKHLNVMVVPEEKLGDVTLSHFLTLKMLRASFICCEGCSYKCLKLDTSKS